MKDFVLFVLSLLKMNFIFYFPVKHTIPNDPTISIRLLARLTASPTRQKIKNLNMYWVVWTKIRANLFPTAWTSGNKIQKGTYKKGEWVSGNNDNVYYFVIYSFQYNSCYVIYYFVYDSRFCYCLLAVYKL